MTVLPQLCRRVVAHKTRYRWALLQNLGLLFPVQQMAVVGATCQGTGWAEQPGVSQVLVSVVPLPALWLSPSSGPSHHL